MKIGRKRVNVKGSEMKEGGGGWMNGKERRVEEDEKDGERRMRKREDKLQGNRNRKK